MANNEVPDERVREYVQRLTPEARSRLLVELERLQLSGDEVKGTESLLAELRAEFRKGGHADDRVKSPPRYFFQPLEPMLVNSAPERAGPGQISRTSLAAVWEWIGQFLLPAMAREYESKMKPVIVADKTADAERIAAAFRSKVVKCLEGVLATAEGGERTRGELAKYTSSRAAFGDLTKTLSVLRAADALAQFNAALPREIGSFAGERLSRGRQLLDAFADRHPDAMPFALTLVARRLKAPWQLIRLATRTARSRNATDIAATRYAVTVAMVLGQLEDKRLELGNALRHDRVLIAKDILNDIFRIDDALRSHINRIEKSQWGGRLDQVMTAVTSDLDAEIDKLPEGVQHIFASRKPGYSTRGLLTSWALNMTDAMNDAAIWCRGIVGAGDRQAG